MSRDLELTTADAADRHGRAMGLAGLMASLNYALSAASNLYDDPVSEYLELAGNGVLGIGIVIALPMVFFILRRLPPEEKHLYFHPDSYIFEAMRAAGKASLAVTMVSLFVLEFVTGRWEAVPSQFFIRVAIAILIGSFAVAFLTLIRGGDSDAG